MDMPASPEVQSRDRHFPNVLLVCGPSGSGKSSFIQSLVEGRLAPELTSLIPDAATRWPTVLENDVRNGRVSPDAIAPHDADDAGVIFHYDTFFVHRIGAPEYARDPIAPHLFQTANLTIINIKPTPAQLKAQYDRRHRDKLADIGYLRGLWHHAGIRPLKRLRYRLLGRGWPYTRDLYERAGAIEECYRSWEGFLASLLSARTATRLVDVVPVGGDGEAARFNLLESR